MSDVNAVIVQPLKQFVKDSVHLVKKCTKPDRKEFVRIASSTAMGFLVMGKARRQFQQRMRHRRRCATHTRAPYATPHAFSTAGFTGFFVKLIHIPINSILMT